MQPADIVAGDSRHLQPAQLRLEMQPNVAAVLPDRTGLLFRFGMIRDVALREFRHRRCRPGVLALADRIAATIDVTFQLRRFFPRNPN